MGSSAPYWLLLAYPVMLSFAFLGNAVAQQGAFELTDGMSLLQVDFTVKRQPKTAVNSSKWFAWDAQFPALTKASKSEGITSDFVRVWTHLGKQWWMEFVDGQFHKDGPHALDHSKFNMKEGMDGEFYKNSKEEYLKFSVPSQWDLPLTAARIAQINAVHEGGRVSCSNASCFEAYRPESISESPRAIDNILADYYNSTMLLQGLERSSRLQKGLPHLTKLFAKFASAQPQHFHDANSRTRLMVLQIEMVRLGGHPVVLWGLRENVYSQCDQVQCDLTGLQDVLLNGWCAWEIVATTGQSPFQSGQYKECYDESTKSCLKNPQPKSPPSSSTWMKEGNPGIVSRA